MIYNTKNTFVKVFLQKITVFFLNATFESGENNEKKQKTALKSGFEFRGRGGMAVCELKLWRQIFKY